MQSDHGLYPFQHNNQSRKRNIKSDIIVHNDLLVITCAIQDLQESSKKHIAELEEEKTSLEKDIENNLKALLEKGVIKLTKR